MTTQDDALQRLMQHLAALPQGEPLDLDVFVDLIRVVRYMGPYTVHNRNGVPHQIDLGQPVKLSVVQGKRPKSGLTTPRRVGDATRS